MMIMVMLMVIVIMIWERGSVHRRRVIVVRLGGREDGRGEALLRVLLPFVDCVCLLMSDIGGNVLLMILMVKLLARLGRNLRGGDGKLRLMMRGLTGRRRILHSSVECHLL